MTDRRGIALTDILIALLIAVFAIVPLLELNTVSRRRGQQGEAFTAASIEAEQLLQYAVRTLGFDELSAKLGASGEIVFGPASEEIRAALDGRGPLDSAALEARRTLRVRRLDPEGLLRVTAILEWRSVAPDREVRFVCDRLLGDPRVSARWKTELGPPPGPDRCGP